MLRLAVATAAETYDRMQEPLRTRDIEAVHVETTERTLSLDTGSDAFDADGFDVGFVYPSRLAEGGVADALLGVPWVNGREEILRSRHKGEALARLSTAGVPTPETVVVSNPTDEAALTAAFERFDGPVVVKPNSTTRGTGVARAHDLDSFLGICDYLDLVHDYRATGDQSFLVQEYLPDARDFRVMVVDGEAVGAVERRLPDEALAAGGWKHNVHRGAEATGVALEDDHRSLAEAAADAMGISWLGIDLLVTDDRAVVNETNARPTIDSATKYESGFWDDVAALVRAQT
ncbi:ribosomal protein S6--L-glutamate ligase [Halovenus aranensis]|uniref:Ribosomal protein S6--L-glutamate ligase n=1 Tax=Halovenus aranensis TaxID=890420 RepID=A0A1G8S723_9EURY|nr:RimK family alpha-L-glutamate ligase [Halovenus aranensis]SDJ25034.1 ribosomal protein S6--L-glutamate ligase [Halovenus aranensis]